MIVIFFFSSRRRHTRLQGDWSSDVCSSDLNRVSTQDRRDTSSPPNLCTTSNRHGHCEEARHTRRLPQRKARLCICAVQHASKIGRASCRVIVYMLVMDVADNE